MDELMGHVIAAYGESTDFCRHGRRRRATARRRRFVPGSREQRIGEDAERAGHSRRFTGRQNRSIKSTIKLSTRQMHSAAWRRFSG